MNNGNPIRGIKNSLRALWHSLALLRNLNRGAVWGTMIVGALLAFEVFNFSTTEFALRDVLGDLTFASMRWATVLAIAFCGIDFAGIARIFTPQQGHEQPAEVWYLFGAWLLAAGFNATLTWWGVSIAIVEHAGSSSNAVIGSETLIKIVPVFVAVMVWLVRVLIIGTFSVSGNRLFSMAEDTDQTRRPLQRQISRVQPSPPTAQISASPVHRPNQPLYRPAPKPSTRPVLDSVEPAYQGISIEAAGSDPSHQYLRQ